jgi:TPR repeat protein
MRRLLALIAISVPLTMSTPAHAIDSVILDAIAGWLADKHKEGDLGDLRERAGTGEAEANYKLFVAYRTAPRSGLAPRVASDTLVSRAEAEAGLRKAAEAGLPDAILALGRLLSTGGMVQRDAEAAKPWLERAYTDGTGEDKATAGSLLGETLLFSDKSNAADKERGLSLVDAALQGGIRQAIRAKARALREGIGIAKDPEAARALLSEAVAAGNGFAYAPLGEMMLKGEGGPKDVEHGLELLGSDKQSVDGLGRAMLADLHLDGMIVPRLPRKAIALLADYAVIDLATRQTLGQLLLDYGRGVPRAEEIGFALAEDEDVGEKDAAWLLVRLARDGSAPFRNEALFYDILERRADTDPRIGILAAGQLAIFSTRGSDAAGDLAEGARVAVESFVARDIAAALTLKGNLLRKGWAYAQDDVAATEAFRAAAEMGDVDGMIELADAYDGGLGTEEDSSQYLTWLRKAAALGAIEARRKLVNQFPFDVFDRQMTLREGITESVALYNDELGSIDAIHFLGLFSNSRLDDFGPGEPVLAFMDGFRAAPAGLDDALLVPLAKQLPKEVLAAIETELKEEGFYQGKAEGHFRPDARKALAAWAAAKGPLPPAESMEASAAPAGPALPDIPAGALARAQEMTLAAIRSAATDDEKAAALAMVADLARFGDRESRWALMRNYHFPEATMLRSIVSPAEMTRFGIDLVLTADPTMEKLDGEFTFAMAQIYMDGHSAEFAESFVAMLREDARLRSRPVLGELLMALVFIPGACDAAIDRAIAEGARELSPGGYCGDLPVRDGFLAFAESALPADIEAMARRAAAGKITAMTRVTAAE